MTKWGKQNIICRKCKNPATLTYETARDSDFNRYFERLCAVCLYWSGWVWIDNGQTKVTIDACG